MAVVIHAKILLIRTGNSVSPMIAASCHLTGDRRVVQTSVETLPTAVEVSCHSVANSNTCLYTQAFFYKHRDLSSDRFFVRESLVFFNINTQVSCLTSEGVIRLKVYHILVWFNCYYLILAVLEYFWLITICLGANNYDLTVLGILKHNCFLLEQQLMVLF